jgi:hypothetical protein
MRLHPFLMTTGQFSSGQGCTFFRIPVHLMDCSISTHCTGPLYFWHHESTAIGLPVVTAVRPVYHDGKAARTLGALASPHFCDQTDFMMGHQKMRQIDIFWKIICVIQIPTIVFSKPYTCTHTHTQGQSYQDILVVMHHQPSQHIWVFEAAQKLCFHDIYDWSCFWNCSDGVVMHSGLFYKNFHLHCQKLR